MPYLANLNVRWGEFDLENLREMRFEPSETERYGLKYGDIVMCEGGVPGRCAVWKEQVPGMMIQKALHRIRPFDGVDSRFLFYSFLKLGRSDELSGLFTGSTIKHLPREKLAKVVIAIPHYELQCRIADILSAYDDLIETNRRRIGLLEEAARLLYREWFVHFRFPGHEHVQIIEGIPERWERKTLGDIITLKRGYDLPDAKRVPGSVPIISSSGVTGFHNHPKSVGPGVITGRYGTLGKVYYVEQNYWPLNTALYVEDFKGAHPLMILYFLRFLLEGITTEKAAVPGLDRNVLHARTVIWPAIKLQSDFVEVVSALQRQMSVLKALNQKLAQARDLLLPRLMSGEIAV